MVMPHTYMRTCSGSMVKKGSSVRESVLYMRKLMGSWIGGVQRFPGFSVEKVVVHPQLQLGAVYSPCRERIQCLKF